MSAAPSTQAIGKALFEARTAARPGMPKGLSLVEAAYQLRDHVPKGFEKTGETIRAYEKGMFTPDDMPTVIVIQGLAKMYGIEIPGFTDSHQPGWKRLADLMVLSAFLPSLYITYMDGPGEDKGKGGEVGPAEPHLLPEAWAA